MNTATATVADVRPVSPDLSVLDDAAEIARFTRPLHAAGGTATAGSSLRIGGMHCGACAGAIEQALRRLDGVIDVRVSAAARCVSV